VLVEHLPRIRRVGSRAGIVVTGTEVLTGRVADRNGPWLAEELRRIGVDVAHVIVVGDRPDDLSAALGFLAGLGLDLIITSGGLGPTADDLTADVVARFQGRPNRLDADLEAHIGSIIERLTVGRGWRLDPAATAAGTRKQALVPVGATVIPPVGTAPGLVVPPAEDASGPPVVVLPGPPRELQGMWPAVVEDALVLAALRDRTELRQRTIRLWGTPESELAATLRDSDDMLGGLEITTCLRDGELEIVTRYAPDAQPAYDAFSGLMEDVYAQTLFSADGRTVDDIVADALRSTRQTIATAESCTGGLLAARLTDRAGASAYVLGGVTAYANPVKQSLLDVPQALLDRVGAVSDEVAQAMAEGIRSRLGADIGVGITGVAGPDGGTAEKPVGLVHISVTGHDRSIARRIELPGARGDVRSRAVVVAMHLIRNLVTAESPS
jgi:nicotinamide-nucleotide amidase